MKFASTVIFALFAGVQADLGLQATIDATFDLINNCEAPSSTSAYQCKADGAFPNNCETPCQDCSYCSSSEDRTSGTRLVTICQTGCCSCKFDVNSMCCGGTDGTQTVGPDNRQWDPLDVLAVGCVTVGGILETGVSVELQEINEVLGLPILGKKYGEKNRFDGGGEKAKCMHVVVPIDATTLYLNLHDTQFATTSGLNLPLPVGVCGAADVGGLGSICVDGQTGLCTGVEATIDAFDGTALGKKKTVTGVQVDIRANTCNSGPPSKVETCADKCSGIAPAPVPAPAPLPAPQPVSAPQTAPATQPSPAPAQGPSPQAPVPAAAPAPIQAPVPAAAPTPDISNKGGMMGDPHILDWGNHWFDYMGQCDLVLVDSPLFQDGTGFTCHVRTKARYDYSFIEKVAIKIANDILEVGSYGMYMVNGVMMADIPFMMGGKYSVNYTQNGKFEHTFDIEIADGELVVIKVFKDLVSVKFDVKTVDFGDSVGLMGQWHTGIHLARDNKTVIEDDNEFGKEWQVRPDEPKLFVVDTDVTECILPMPKKDARRRLGETISTEAAELACAHFEDEGLHSACVYDVIATGDLDMAKAGAF